MDWAIAIDRLRPGAKWRRSQSYQDLLDTWLDETTLPSEAELLAAYEDWASEQVGKKVWENTALFHDEFTDEEKYLLHSSGLPPVIVARSNLAMWRGEVWNNDQRIIDGLQILVDNAIITAERKTEILNG